ncbi:hypothetical protein K474DRAFT_1265162 [Panus rudis PR-1116 ss-1]|nr:hypothetical protein K474DRAFT_1265162 [Panus rudis PR-1116 ss-1]
MLGSHHRALEPQSPRYIRAKSKDGFPQLVSRSSFAVLVAPCYTSLSSNSRHATNHSSIVTMRLTLTSALLAFSLISYVSAHPLAVEPDSRVSELAERDVDHFQWLERRVTPEEEAARRLRNDRAYKARKAEKLRALDERARQGDEQAKAEFDAITEARRASNRAAAKKFRDKKKAEKAQDSASASGGSGSQGASSGYRPSQGGSSGYHQAGSSGYQPGTTLPSIHELQLPRPPLQQSQPSTQPRGPPLTDYLRQGRSQGGSYGGQYQGGQSSGR